MPLLPELITRRIAHPELRHGKWLVTFFICRLQESWRAALARSAGRNGITEKFQQVPALTLSIQESKLLEQPLLKGDAAVVPLLLQLRHLLLHIAVRSLIGQNPLLPFLL